MKKSLIIKLNQHRQTINKNLSSIILLIIPDIIPDVLRASGIRGISELLHRVGQEVAVLLAEPLLVGGFRRAICDSKHLNKKFNLISEIRIEFGDDTILFPL